MSSRIIAIEIIKEVIEKNLPLKIVLDNNEAIKKVGKDESLIKEIEVKKPKNIMEVGVLITGVQSLMDPFRFLVLPIRILSWGFMRKSVFKQ